MPNEITKKYSSRNTVAWAVTVFMVALWVFVVFFLDGIIGNLAGKELIRQTASATHGAYQLSFTSFCYHRGAIIAGRMDITRAGYRANERGSTLRELTIDTVRISGIRWWGIVFSHEIGLSEIQAIHPKIYFCDASEERERTQKILPDTTKSSGPSAQWTLQIGSIEIPNVALYGRTGTQDYDAGTLSFDGREFSFDPKSKALFHATIKTFDLQIPWVQYADSSGSYFIRNASTSSNNSLAVDTFSYANASTELRSSGFSALGMNLFATLSSKQISVRSLHAKTWAAKFNTGSDTSLVTPSKLPWQDKLARSIGYRISIDTVALNDGTISIRWSQNSKFDANDLNLNATQFDLDTGAAAERPCFAREFSAAADEATYRSTSEWIGVENFTGSVEDSLITTESVAFNPKPGDRNTTAPIQFEKVRAEGIHIMDLLSGREIAMRSLRASAWEISGLPVGTTSKKSKPVTSIWDVQQNIAASVSMPVRIGYIDLEDGTVHVNSGMTLDAERAGINVVNFNLDSSQSATRNLFFSNDIHLQAAVFHFADDGRHNIVDARNAHSKLRARSIVAGRVTYVSRAPDEPELNNTAYTAHDLDLTGIDFAGLFDNKEILVEHAKVGSWQIERKADSVSNPEKAIEKKTRPEWQLPIRVRHAVLPNGTVTFLEPDTVPGTFATTLSSTITTLTVNHFHFLPPHRKRPRIGYRQVICMVPNFTYDALRGFYVLKITNFNANLHDSIVTMDSIGYIPKYSEDQFAALHKYARGRTDFRLADAKLVGIDARRLINGGGVIMDSFIAPTLWLDYYKDDREPSDPNPGPAIMPNDIVRSVNLPFTVQNISFQHGHIQLREQDKKEDSTGDFSFENVSILASPITLDSLSSEIDTPTRFEMSGNFIAQAPTRLVMMYPLHDSGLNLSIDGTVGPFDLMQLNSYLIPCERCQVMNGKFSHGDVQVKIANDVATTYVSPIYNHFKLRILPPDPNDPRDIEEGMKTFIANTFVLRDDDPDEKGGPPITATTTLARKPDQEYFQFIWLAIRHSLGKVVGGFQ